MPITYVIKADGTRAAYDREHITNTCLRAGVGKKIAQKVADAVEQRLQDGMKTRVIYKIIYEELERVSRKAAEILGLREAISQLDSQSFELYAKKVLEANGWYCEWNKIIHGAVVEHQVDVIAKKENKTMLVECKRHFNPHRWTGLDVCLQVQARLEDLEDGRAQKKNDYTFTGAWIFTNTKFSEHARIYAKAKKIMLTGWRSGDLELQELAEGKKIYPTTVLKISNEAKLEMLSHQIITIQDLLASKKEITPEFSEARKQAKELSL